MKGIVLFVSAFALCFGLMACSNNASSSSSAASSSAASSSVAASASTDITIEDLVAANTRDAIFARHATVMETRRNDAYGMRSLFATPDLSYAEFGENEEILSTKDGVWAQLPVDEQPTLVYQWYAMSDEEAAISEMAANGFSGILDEASAEYETIEKVVDNGDGTLTITAVVNLETFKEFDEIRRAQVAELPEGAELLEVYVVDKNTLESKRSSECVRQDGVETMLGENSVEYDVDQPQRVTEMLSSIEEFRSATVNDPKTVTVIYDAGTPQEQQYSITVDEKYGVTPILRDGYNYLYSDAERTHEIVDDTISGDTTIYAFATEKAA